MHRLEQRTKYTAPLGAIMGEDNSSDDTEEFYNPVAEASEVEIEMEMEREIEVEPEVEIEMESELAVEPRTVAELERDVEEHNEALDTAVKMMNDEFDPGEEFELKGVTVARSEQDTPWYYATEFDEAYGINAQAFGSAQQLVTKLVHSEERVGLIEQRQEIMAGEIDPVQTCLVCGDPVSSGSGWVIGSESSVELDDDVEKMCVQNYRDDVYIGFHTE